MEAKKSKRHNANFGADRYIYYLDCGGAFIGIITCKKSNCTLQICVVDYISIIPKTKLLTNKLQVRYAHLGDKTAKTVKMISIEIRMLIIFRNREEAIFWEGHIEGFWSC